MLSCRYTQLLIFNCYFDFIDLLLAHFGASCWLMPEAHVNLAWWLRLDKIESNLQNERLFISNCIIFLSFLWLSKSTPFAELDIDYTF